MSKKVTTVLSLEIPAGKAQPAPPLGPMLGANGVNIGTFIKEFNDKTMDFMKEYGGFDVKIKCDLTVFSDRTFSLEVKGPVTSDLLKWKLKLKKGSGEPNKTKVGKVTRSILEEVAAIKLPDFNTNNLESAISSIAGTAKSLGLDIEPGAIKKLPWKKMAV